MTTLTPIFEGQVSAGRLSLDKKQQFLAYLQSLDGKRVQVTVEKLKPQRSRGQNAYYWGVVVKLIADHTGAEPEEIHTALKYHFCPKRFVGNLVAPASTKRLDTIDFADYTEKVKRWALEELGLRIPEPGEVSLE
jgi:hypothetical protein